MKTSHEDVWVRVPVVRLLQAVESLHLMTGALRAGDMLTTEQRLADMVRALELMLDAAKAQQRVESLLKNRARKP